MNCWMPLRLVSKLARGGLRGFGARLLAPIVVASLAGVLGVSGPVSASQVSGGTTLAAGDTLVGTFSNSKADVTVTKKVTGTGSDRLAVYVADVVGHSQQVVHPAGVGDGQGEQCGACDQL
jgi:hypothetical protein